VDIKKQEPGEPQKERKELSSKQNKFRIGTFISLALIFLAAWFLLQLRTFAVFGTWLFILKKLSLAGFSVFTILAVSRIVELFLLKGTHTLTERYNLLRVIRLLSVILCLMVIISFTFQNWYTAAVSLGLISLILGFALQTPISSFIGWVYIIFRTPYHVGDRIQIQNFTGDVVEIGYIDTTLWEFGGDYLTSDMPSGRLIRFPNSLVFQYAVYNYSWKKFPYIWNEIPFHIAYESDLLYVESTLRDAVKAELGDDMKDEIEKLKHLIEQTPVNEIDIKEYPYITFRTNANTWIEVTITYLVKPKKAAAVRSRIVKKSLSELLKKPDAVMFPKGNNR
jgi:small-conductance mechanosensitive channel